MKIRVENLKEVEDLRRTPSKAGKNKIKNVRDWKSFGKDFFSRFVPRIVCIAFHSFPAYDEICVFVFIHFSRDLTFYYVCALKLEGEKKFFLLRSSLVTSFISSSSSCSPIFFPTHENIFCWLNGCTSCVKYTLSPRIFRKSSWNLAKDSWR